MITYNGLDLFSSGPGTLERGPGQSPGLIVQSLSSIESAAVSSSYAPRLITQYGMLLADSPAELQALIDAIDANVDQSAEDLVEVDVHTWPGCVMRSFSHEPRMRLGARFGVTYTVTYLQTSA